MNSKAKLLIKQIEDNVKKTGKFGVVSGAYGDMENCEGIIEEVVMPPEGGTFTKFYGCSYLFKGVPLVEIVEGIGLAKSMISALPREIIMRSILFQIALVLYAIFSPKRLNHYLRVYIEVLHSHTMSRLKFPPIRYNKLTNEMRRAFDKAITKEMAKRGLEFDSAMDWKNAGQGAFATDKVEFYMSMRLIMDFIYVFIECDNAYRFRLQDMFENLNQERVGTNVTKEVLRLIQILINREYQINSKWIQMKKLFRLLLLVSPRFRGLIREFLLELEIEKVSLDEADWYFCLRRNGYDFRGIPVEERLKEKERIDKEKGHILLKLQKVDDPQCPKMNGSCSISK